MRRLLAGIATTVLTLGPAMGAFALEALAPGSYLVDLGGGVIAEVTLTSDNFFSVSSVGDTSASIKLGPKYSGGAWQDEFTLTVDGTSYYVDLNVAADGSYEVVVDGVVVEVPTSGESTDPNSDVPDDDGSEANDESSDDDAPGQHGRDNAREHGGNANGHGAEGTSPKGA